jgi:hypothetical protein
MLRTSKVTRTADSHGKQVLTIGSPYPVKGAHGDVAPAGSGSLGNHVNQNTQFEFHTDAREGQHASGSTGLVCHLVHGPVNSM